jgi:hypothetical protein
MPMYCIEVTTKDGRTAMDWVTAEFPLQTVFNLMEKSHRDPTFDDAMELFIYEVED